MISSLFVGYVILDNVRMTPRQRAIRGLALIAIFNLGQWVYAAWVQYQWSAFYNHQEEMSMYVWDKDNRATTLTGAPLCDSCSTESPPYDPNTYNGTDVCLGGLLYAPYGSQ